jgi:hypothetical protein
MSKSTPKIEKIYEDILAQSKLDEGKSPEQLFKEKVEMVAKRIKQMKRVIIISSNIFMVMTVFLVFAIYMSIVQGLYTSAVLESIMFLFSMYQLLDTYFMIRLYSSEMKIQQIEKDKCVEN